MAIHGAVAFGTSMLARRVQKWVWLHENGCGQSFPNHKSCMKPRSSIYNNIYVRMCAYTKHVTITINSFVCSLSKKRECVVIMSIHQPRYSIFKLFDTLTLLSLGDMVYHGTASNSLTYFKDLGTYHDQFIFQAFQ